jgi:anti-sigma regulatory factor (Ser/Thr protein kinase)
MTDHALWSHDINLDDQPVSASQARTFVRQHLDEHHLAHLSDDVALVVTELATNAMRHARTAFTVHLHADDQTLLLEVEDGSHSWPVRTAAVHGCDPHGLDTHGRGLTIVDHLCRGWGTNPLPSGGKSVWAEFTLR